MQLAVSSRRLATCGGRIAPDRNCLPYDLGPHEPGAKASPHVRGVDRACRRRDGLRHRADQRPEVAGAAVPRAPCCSSSAARAATRSPTPPPTARPRTCARRSTTTAPTSTFAASGRSRACCTRSRTAASPARSCRRTSSSASRRSTSRGSWPRTRAARRRRCPGCRLHAEAGRRDPAADRDRVDDGRERTDGRHRHDWADVGHGSPREGEAIRQGQAQAVGGPAFSTST